MVHFTKLRLQGFKSFVETTELAIQPGMTGIVGPNGCGKSNLVEALRWVMGENSAKRMRGTGMDDMIFAGTATRPSRNMAEVTLTLDNTTRTAPAAFNEMEEVAITRRIEREKGSDYSINGNDVRMRDVQLLFADLASGANSPAMVSQGRVGAPLDIRTYRTVTLALRRYFAVTVVDCETLPGEVARTAMDTAHARVVVAPMTAEGVNGTRQVLDWLGQLPHSALSSTVVALTAGSPDVTLDRATAVAHLKESGVHVVTVPYDRHLAQGGPIRTALLGQETRAAAITLAAEAMTRAVRMR